MVHNKLLEFHHMMLFIEIPSIYYFIVKHHLILEQILYGIKCT